MTPAERIADLAEQLVDGWRERVEYNAHVTVHTDACRAERRLLEHGDDSDKANPIPPRPGALRHHSCHCPRRLEARAESRMQPALLAQLRELRERPTDGETSARTAPESTPPGPLAALELLATIRGEANTLAARARAALGYDVAPRRQRSEAALRGLVSLAVHLGEDSELAQEMVRALARLRAIARVLLAYDAPTTFLRDVVCPECGGRLRVAADASTDVRCAGGEVAGPARPGEPWPVRAPGCGAVWRRWQWADLLSSEEERHD
ncbi:DUF7341 domain-containing protein [Nocardiopsis synnemataformans]|uniref:DUF7341 domain-containing protein n=1 Tax=Nocardiopsis synnemataformans TaxID=61305 RepID=UPI003EC009D2